jgi:hypothetical protein
MVDMAKLLGDGLQERRLVITQERRRLAGGGRGRCTGGHGSGRGLGHLDPSAKRLQPEHGKVEPGQYIIVENAAWQRCAQLGLQPTAPCQGDYGLSGGKLANRVQDTLSAGTGYF